MVVGVTIAVSRCARWALAVVAASVADQSHRRLGRGRCELRERARRLALERRGRLDPGCRRRLLVPVREGDGGDDARRPDVFDQPRRHGGTGAPLRRVPLWASGRIERRRRRRERDRTGRSPRGYGAAGPRRAAARARPRDVGRPLANGARPLDAGVARRGPGAHRNQRPDLCLPGLLEVQGRRHVDVRRLRPPSVDRALDEEPSPLVPASNWGGGFGWDVLAMDGLLAGAGLRRTARRRPGQRDDPSPVAFPRSRPERRSPSTPPTIVGTARRRMLAGVPGTWGRGEPSPSATSGGLRRRGCGLHADPGRHAEDVHAEAPTRGTRSRRPVTATPRAGPGSPRRRRRRQSSRPEARSRRGRRRSSRRRSPASPWRARR